MVALLVVLAFVVLVLGLWILMAAVIEIASPIGVLTYMAAWIVLLSALVGGAAYLGTEGQRSHHQVVYEEGYGAALHGVPPEACHYSHESIYYGDWKRGWQDGFLAGKEK